MYGALKRLQGYLLNPSKMARIIARSIFLFAVALWMIFLFRLYSGSITPSPMHDLILTGVMVGVVAAVLLRIYFNFAVFPKKPKGPLFVLGWGFYVGVIFVAATMSSEVFEHLGILKKLDKFEERLAYYLSWFVPVAITIGFSLFQVCKQRASRSMG